MSRVVQLLPESLINRIAAGEVVERPASVVKELLENSVDAGADDIQVDILQSGKSSIRITDNGRGMTREDLVLAVERHATSKIRDYADLLALKSMGFRGEALPSIAAISRMTIHSIPQGSVSGNRLEIWGGKKNRLEEVGGASGTIVEVLDLFYNTPARMAFLKAPRAEWHQIQMALERVALGFPALRFGLSHNGKKVLSLFPSQGLTLRLNDLWGEEKISDLIPVELEEDRIRITGYISPPHRHQNTSRNMALIVNQRWVRSPLLYPLILRAYGTMLPSGRFPISALWMEVPPELIDINIHPTKQEVRFSHTTLIQTLVGKALARALKSNIPDSSVSERALPASGWAQDQSQPFLLKEAPLPLFWSPGPQGKTQEPFPGEGSLGFRTTNPETGPMTGKSPNENRSPETEEGFAGLTVLTQLQGTYLVASLDRGLILIDQHAAHERILYEQYQKQWQGGGVSSQYLVVPILIEMPPGSNIDPESVREAFSGLGFEWASAGVNSLWLKSIPAGMDTEQAESVFKEILEGIKAGGRVTTQEALLDSMLKLLACHSAIRAGQVLSPEEMKALLRKLDQTECPSHCPHGRPLWFILSWEEIEKRFRRR